MIEIKKPVIPESVEESLLEIRKKADRIINDGEWWDVSDTLEEAKQYPETMKWFEVSPENKEEFLLAFLFSYELEESWFYLKYKYPEYLGEIGEDTYLNYNTYDKRLILSSSVNSVKYQTIFKESDLIRLGVDVNDFEKKWA